MRQRVQRVTRYLATIGVGGIGAVSAFATMGTAVAAPAPLPDISGHVLAHLTGPQPPTSAQCLAAFNIACYDPAQIRSHYNLGELYEKGWTGAGKTIVIVDSFGSPTISTDLKAWDAFYHLPNPKLTVIQPVGKVPPFDPTNSTMVGWAGETTLDVEWSHTIAPGANILLVETPNAETEGTVGFPKIVAAENYVINHHLGDVISQSFGATEQTFPGAESIYDLRSAFINAKAHNVTVLASSGDNGITNAYFDGSCCYAHPANSWPSADPLVSSIGGTELVPNADGNPRSLAHDVVWQDPNSLLDGNPSDPTTCCAGGGGLSVVFPRPEFQDSVAGRVGKSRGTPDISMSASVSGAVLTYSTYAPSGPSFSLVGGTSEASPMFAGIVAISDQVAGHDLGFLNPRLYGLAQAPANGIVDVTKGNNGLTFLDAHNGNALTTVTGNVAGPGYDLASGWGTVDAATFVPALAGF
jgi:subtilase family serine protease